MTNEELVMNMLAELTTTNITKEEHPQTMSEHARVAERGGSVARVVPIRFRRTSRNSVRSSTGLSQKESSRCLHSLGLSVKRNYMVFHTI